MRRRWIRTGWMGLLLLAFTACPSPPELPAEDAGVPDHCPSGFFAADGGPACLPLIAEGDCPVGSAARLGSRECHPLGWQGCPEGFFQAPNEWGCQEVLPAAPCTGPSLERLGATECVPLGDCAAPFPPPGATHFVDPGYTAGQLDGTHFKTLASAVTAAPSGAVVAIHPGTYPEALRFTRPLTLIGRCPAQVIMQNTAGAGIALDVSGLTGVVVKGITIKGYRAGARLEKQAGLTLEEVLIQDTAGLGIAVMDDGHLVARKVGVREPSSVAGEYGWTVFGSGGARLEFEDSVLSGGRNISVSLEGVSLAGKASELLLTRSVVRDQVSVAGAPDRSVAVRAVGGSKLTATRSAFVRHSGDAVRIEGIGAGGRPSQALLIESVIRGTRGDADERYARGAAASHGGSLRVERCAVISTAGAGLWANGTGSELMVLDSVVRHTEPENPADIPTSAGVLITEKAQGTLSGVVLAHNPGIGVGVELQASLHLTSSFAYRNGQGVVAQFGARLEASRSTLKENRNLGLLISGDEGGVVATGKVSDLLIEGTTGAGGSQWAHGAMVQEGGILEATRVALVGNRGAGLMLSKVPGAMTRESKVTLVDSTATLNGWGDGYTAGLLCGATLEVRGSTIWQNGNLGVGVVGPGLALIQDSLIGASRQIDPVLELGHGVLVLTDGRVELERTQLSLNQRIGLIVESGGARVRGSLLEDNAVGVHVQGQSQLQVAGGSVGEVSAREVVISEDTRFERNAVRVGSGSVPLPPLRLP